MQQARLAGTAGRRWHFDGQLRCLERARDMRLDQRAGPRSVKICLPHKGHGQSRRPFLAIALQSQAAQNGVELRNVARLKVDGERRRARDGVSTQRASRNEIARGQVQLQVAQVDSAIALCIRGINGAGRRRLACRSFLQRAQSKCGRDGDRAHIAVRPGGSCRTIDAGGKTKPAILRRADDIENRVERDAFEVGRDLAVHRDGNYGRVDKHVAGLPRFLGLWRRDGRRNLRGNEFRSGKPGLERDRTFDLAALAQTGDDLGDQELFTIRVDPRIEVDARGVHARAEVRTIVHVDTAGDLKSWHVAACGEMEMSDAFGRVGVAGDGIQEPHIEISVDFRLPARMTEIIECSRDLQYVVLAATAVRRELQAAQPGAIALEIEGELKLSLHRRNLFSWQLASENKILGGGVDAIALRRAE